MPSTNSTAVDDPKPAVSRGTSTLHPPGSLFEKPGRRRSAWRQRLIEAERGVTAGFRGDSTMFVHFFSGCAILAAAVVLRITLVEWALLILALSVVIAAEMFNKVLGVLGRHVAEAEGRRSERQRSEVRAAEVGRRNSRERGPELKSGCAREVTAEALTSDDSAPETRSVRGRGGPDCSAPPTCLDSDEAVRALSHSLKIGTAAVFVTISGALASTGLLFARRLWNLFAGSAS